MYQEGPGTTAGLVPPHNSDAEQSVLLNVVLAPEVIPDVLAVLRSPDDFYHEDHREIFRSVLALYSAGLDIDVIAVAEHLQKAGHASIAKFGGPLDQLCQLPNFAANAVNHAIVVQQKAVLRGTMEAAEKIIRDGYSNRKSADAVLADALARLQGIATEHMGSGTVTVAETLPTVLERMERRQQGEVIGLPSGLSDLDSITDGFQPQELVLVGARSSMGKTSLALQICDHISVNWGKPSLFISLEMNEVELSQRVLIARARVDGHKIRTGSDLDADETQRIGDAYAEITRGQGPIHILVRPTRNITQIVSEARAIKARHGIEFVVVDYIQQIDSDNSGDGEVQALTKISKALKNLARDLNIPLLVLSQLNRSLESREDKTPRMFDLRGSGSLEQDADIILMVHRPEYFDPLDRPGVAQLVIAKNRNGRTGSIDLVFMKHLMRFGNLAQHVTTRPQDFTY